LRFHPNFVNKTIHQNLAFVKQNDGLVIKFLQTGHKILQLLAAKNFMQSTHKRQLFAASALFSMP